MNNFDLDENIPVLQRAYDKHGKFYRDYIAIKEQFENLQAGRTVNYLVVVSVLGNGIGVHNSGKIETIQSLDVTTICEFCETRRKQAINNPLDICGYCYANKDEKGFRISNMLPRHWLNMKILSIFELPIDVLRLLPISTIYFRFSSYGDIVNEIHAENIIKIAFVFDFIQFALWTKNCKAIQNAVDKLGKPDNLRIVQSAYLINGTVEKIPCADIVFTVFDKEHILTAIKSGCNECNGKKCKLCGFKCYKNPENGGWNENTVVAELLRE